MTLAERLRAALDAGKAHGPLLPGDDVTLPADSAALVPAAVLVAVTDRPTGEEPGVLLTTRTATLRKHAGQIAFPGGRIDPGDSGPVAAALREADEEIGLPPGCVEVVGLADPYRTGTGYRITPVLGVIPPDLPLTPHEAEVADWFEVPLAFLLDPANHREASGEWQGRRRSFYEIPWRGRRIWGATAAMIVNLARRLAYAA